MAAASKAFDGPVKSGEYRLPQVKCRFSLLYRTISGSILSPEDVILSVLVRSLLLSYERSSEKCSLLPLA